MVMWAYRALQFRSDAQQRCLVLLPLLPLPLLLRLLCLLLNDLLHRGLVLSDELDMRPLWTDEAEAGSNRTGISCACSSARRRCRQAGRQAGGAAGKHMRQVSGGAQNDSASGSALLASAAALRHAALHASASTSASTGHAPVYSTASRRSDSWYSLRSANWPWCLSA